MLLFTLALMAIQVIAAFPVRGSLWRSLDSAFVIDGDTVVVEQAHCACFCLGYQYSLAYRMDDTSRLRRLSVSGPVQYMYLVSVASKPIGADGVMIQCSTPTVAFAPTNHRQFLLRGKHHQWALWADSIAQNVMIPTTQTHGRFKARWRWSRIDSTLPWVRWIDTLYLGSLEMAPRAKPSLHSQPVLTTLRSVSLDSLVPAGTSCGSGLFLGSDTLGAREWGYSGPYCSSGSPFLQPLVPALAAPAGRTFRPVVAYNSGLMAKWTLRHEGRKIDSLWMHGTASASVSRPAVVPVPPRSGTRAIEPATGRLLPLDKPLPTGSHLLAGPGGPRLVVVE